MQSGIVHRKVARAERAAQGWPADRPLGDDYTAAATLGISRSKWWQLVRAGDAPAPVRVGRRSTRWRRSDVMTYIESRPAVRISNEPAAA